MPNYDFLNLSPTEFQELVRDLIQEKENIIFQSFKEGKDQGIDFRYESANGLIIGQAKRFKNNLPYLFRELKKEMIKVGKLKPARYILATSVSLSLANKEEIVGLFDGYIKDCQDVLGKEDLNNLLGIYTHIETNHIKLWLASSNVLTNLIEGIVNRGAINLAHFELERIKQSNQYYVPNPSFNDARKILSKDRIVVISGPPGGGKTTLARVLVSHLIAKEDCSLIYISENIQEGFDLYKPEERQVFFYDDFLGSISFEGFRKNEDKRLIEFAEMISRSRDKYLILTTREYVFNKSKLEYNRIEAFDLKKCIVDSSGYDDWVRAKILYNHLYFSDLDQVIIDNLLSDKGYLRIIHHKNYTPRLIEDFIKKEPLRDDVMYFNFTNKFCEYLNKPYKFWEEAFEKQSKYSQLLLLLLLVSNEPIYMDDLKECLDATIPHYNISFTDMRVAPDTFTKSIKELQDSFIVVNSDGNYKSLGVIEFQNPSVKDFLLQYLREHESWIDVLIKGAVFFDQLFFVFTTGNSEEKIDDYESESPLFGKKIVLLPSGKQVLKEKLLSEFLQLKSGSQLEKTHWIGGDISYSIKKTERCVVYNLYRFHLAFNIHEDVEVRTFIVKILKACLLPDTFNNWSYYGENMNELPLLIKVILPYANIDGETFIKDFYHNIRFASHFFSFQELNEVFPEAHIEFLNRLNKTELRLKVEEVIKDDVDYFQINDMELELEGLMDQVDEIFSMFGIKKTKKFNKELNYLLEEDSVQNVTNDYSRFKKKPFEEKDIEDLFGSLGRKQEYFEEEDDDLVFIQQVISDANVKNLILTNLERLSQFRYTPEGIYFLASYFEQYADVPSSRVELYNRIIGLLRLHKPILPGYDLVDIMSELLFSLFLAGKNACTERYLMDELSRIAGGSDKAEEIADVLSDAHFLWREQRNWRFIPNLMEYMVALKLSKSEKPFKANFYQILKGDDFIDKAYDWKDDFWPFLSELDNAMFMHAFVIPEIEQFLSSIDTSSFKTTVVSLVKHTRFDCSVELDNDGQFTMSSSSGISLIPEILDYFDIPLSLDYDIYFTTDTYRGEYAEEVEKLFLINRDVYGELYEYITQKCSGKKCKPFHHEEEVMEYEIPVEKLIENEDFYHLIRRMGMESHIVRGIAAVEKKMSGWKLKYTFK